MLNGLLTLRGAWNKVRESAILKFFVLAVTFYGMATFEGPMLAIKSINKLTHYTDWTIAHVHAGALGWVGFMIFGTLYFLIPRLWKRKLYSENLATTHFWVATIGLLLYIIPIWSAGLMQGLMWRAFDADGLLVIIAASIGGIVEIGPLLIPKSYVPMHASAAVPYTALELEERDIYLREGCMNCHSQMIRPLRDEVLRYGDYSKPGESEYEHPFQWGSRRIGPDLARVGGKYPDHWHYLHFQDPRSTSPGSIMPPYPWLLTAKLDASVTAAKMKSLRTLNVPYSDKDIRNAGEDLNRQALEIAARLDAEGYPGTADKEIVAVIAYLQRLGKHPEPIFAGAP